MEGGSSSFATPAILEIIQELVENWLTVYPVGLDYLAIAGIPFEVHSLRPEHIGKLRKLIIYGFETQVEFEKSFRYRIGPL
jgi:hypothetical protein